MGNGPNVFSQSVGWRQPGEKLERARTVQIGINGKSENKNSLKPLPGL